MLHYGNPSASIDGSGTWSDSPTGSSSGSSSGSVSYPVYETTGGEETPSGGSTGGGSGTGTQPGQTMSYPISKFLASQGTFCADNGMGGCALYMGPAGNYLGWYNRAQSMSAAVDYAGMASNWLMQNGRSIGTTINGTVIEEVLPDGSRRVTVDLHGDRVMAFVTTGSDLRNAASYGYKTGELRNSANAPALGHTTLRATFILPAGAPMPDLMQLIVAPQAGQKLESFSLMFEGDGINRMTGQNEHVQIVYDGSTGPIYPSHPASPGQTPAMGQAQIVFTGGAQPVAVDQ